MPLLLFSIGGLIEPWELFEFTGELKNVRVGRLEGHGGLTQ